MTAITAAQFAERLEAHRSDEQQAKIQRYFKSTETGDDIFIGVPMGQVFALAKEFVALPPDQLETLLESPIHEVRAGALSIMDKQGRAKKSRTNGARSSSTSISGGTTGSTTGTSSTSARRS